MNSNAPNRVAVQGDQLLGWYVETTEHLLAFADAEGRITSLNPAAAQTFELDRGDPGGADHWCRVHPEDAARTRAVCAEWFADEDREVLDFENRMIGPGGAPRDVFWTLTRWRDEAGVTRGFVSCGRDVTETRRVQGDLHHTQRRLAAVLDGMLDPVVTIDSVGKIRDANRSCAEAFGYEPAELLGQNIKILMPEPHRSAHDGYLAHYRATGQTGILNRTRAFQVVRKDGGLIDIELSVSRIEVPGTDDPLFCGSFRNVTARRAAERALAESEARFRAIFDQEFQFVGLLDSEGTLLEANQASLDAAGAERDAVVGRPFWNSPWFAHSEREKERMRLAVRDAAAGEFVRFETSYVLADGSHASVDFSLKPIRDEEGRVVQLLPEGRDITELKRVQRRELTMMRAFAEIGESASLLAHEIKNPITAVNLALRAVADKLGEDEQEVLTELVERLQRVERMMRRTLSLARPLDLELEERDPGALAEGAAALVRNEIEARGITLETSVAADLRPIRVDPGLLEEVLTNLLRNAAEALERGGRIRLSVDREGQLTRMRIEDDGPGVPAEVGDSVFKPFVSTKDGGTGLGLALARKIVEAHDGRIGLSTSPMGGARFEIQLPPAPAPR